MSTEKTKRLGRGLDALLGGSPKPDLRFPAARTESGERGDRPGAPEFQTIPVDAIVPNPQQPRRSFDDAELAELQASIRANGLLQPLIVRPMGSGFELVAGERRYRAVRALGWKTVPAHVRPLDDQALLTVALIENLQRTDLNPIEEAEGYQTLVSRFSLTQQQVADAVGRERSTVANVLRLLALPEPVRTLVRDGSLTLGHARALLGLSDAKEMTALASAIVQNGLTVRDVEQRVRDAGTSTPRGRARKVAAVDARAPEARAIEEQLRRRFQTDVALSANAAGKGEVRLAFYSNDDLERLLDLLLGKNREVL